MSSFTSPLIVTPLHNGIDWKLLKEFDYHVGSEDGDVIVHVPKGFETDFASTRAVHILSLVSVLIYVILSRMGFVVNWLGIIVVLLSLFCLFMPAWGRFGKAAVVHDFLYKTKELMGKPISRKTADHIFMEAMIVAKTATWLATLMYYGIRLGAWSAWKQKKL